MRRESTLSAVSQLLDSARFHDALVITSAAAGDDVFTLAGRRCLVTGGETRGIDDVRIHPYCVARDVRVADARTTSFHISRIGIERTLQLPQGAVRERILVPADAPGIVIEWSAQQATNIELHWQAEGAIGVRTGPNALTVKHPASDDVLFEIDTADAVWHVHDGKDANTITVTCSVHLGSAGIRLIIASGTDTAGVESAAQLLRDPDAIAAARKGTLARARNERLFVHTPDQRIDHAIAWSAHRLAAYAVEIPGVGASLVDSYNTATAPVFVTRAAVWTALGLLASGDERLPREVIRFMLQHQDASGRIPDSCTPGGGVVNGSSEATALFLLLVAHLTAWTGDFAIPTHSWEAITRACSAVAEDAGTPARIDALTEIAFVAEAVGKKQLAVALRARSSPAATPVVSATERGRIVLPVTSDVDAQQPGAHSILGAFAESTACTHFAAGHSAAGFEDWRNVAYSCFDRTKGAWEDGAIPDASLPTGTVMLAVVHGILGAEPDAAKHRLVLRPQIPFEWNFLEVKNLRLGEADISLHYVRTGMRHLFTLEQRAGSVPVRVIFEPLLPASRITSAHVDGQPAELDPRRFGERLMVPVQIVLDHERVIELEAG